jgi:hypothetical protein
LGRIELTGLFAMLLGVWYPKHYVLAAINATDGAAAVEALLSAGFGSNSVRLEDSAGVCRIRAASWSATVALSPTTTSVISLGFRYRAVVRCTSLGVTASTRLT